MNPAAQLSAFYDPLIWGMPLHVRRQGDEPASSLNSVLSSQSNDGDATTDTRLFSFPRQITHMAAKDQYLAGPWKFSLCRRRSWKDELCEEGWPEMSEPIGYIDESNIPTLTTMVRLDY